MVILTEMARLGDADRFIDALQGRIPCSVLAKHYTDYRPKKLKFIYDKTNLVLFKCLSNVHRPN